MRNLEKSLFDVIGKPKEVSDKIQALQRNVRYFETNYDQLVAQFPREWVAIFNETVLAHHPSYIKLLHLIRETKVKAYVQYLDTKPRTQILHEALVSLPVGV